MSSTYGNIELEATSSAAVVRVSTTPILPAIPQSQRKDDFQVLVTVEAPAPKVVGHKKRAPMDLVAVLDVSGSMNYVQEEERKAVQGEVSRLTLLKAAMDRIISSVGYDDRMAIVAFNKNLVTEYTTKLIEVAGHGRTKLKDSVTKLTACLGTVFKPGLDKAVEILNGRGEDEKKKRVGFILFLSDGRDGSKIKWEKLATSTDGDESRLRETLRQYAVYTFGFSAFHDPVSLLAIAQVSYGTYSYISKDLEKIKQAFALVLGGIGNVVAVDVQVHLKPQQQDANGQHRVVINKIDCGVFNRHIEGGGTSGKIDIPVLYAGEVKKFIVHLGVPQLTATGQQGLLTVGGQFRDVSSDEPATNVPIDDHHLDIEVVDKADDDLRPAPQVVKQVVMDKLLAMLTEIVEDVKDETKKGQVAATLRHKWDSIKSSNDVSSWSSLDVDARQRIDDEVSEIADKVEKGVAKAYICSWVSSHQMQRATTMDSPDKVVHEFMTQDMETMVENSTTPLPQDKKDQGTKAMPAPAPAPEPAPPAGQNGDPSSPRVAQELIITSSEQECPWCAELDMIEDHLACWSNVKRDLLRMLEEDVQSASGRPHCSPATSSFHAELSLGNINRAMYQSVCQAVEHARKLREYTACCKGTVSKDNY